MLAGVAQACRNAVACCLWWVIIYNDEDACFFGQLELLAQPKLQTDGVIDRLHILHREFA